MDAWSRPESNALFPVAWSQWQCIGQERECRGSIPLDSVPAAHGEASTAPTVVPSGVSLQVTQKGVWVKKSMIPAAGLGLFAASVFERGECITEYEGTVLSTTQAKALACQTHLCSAGRGIVIDGLRRPVMGRGGASFANDCVGNTTGLLYNAEKTSGLGRVYLKATRKIRIGEEIFWKYGRINGAALAVAMGIGHIH